MTDRTRDEVAPSRRDSGLLALPVSAQPLPHGAHAGPAATDERSDRGNTADPDPNRLPAARRVRLPIAAGLACVLALRPRRKGTPQRQAPVIQTQIILAVVGAVVMLVVGASLARAFGIVGAAGLVRYRAKINDPKDAGVMLSTLAVGLAAGVGCGCWRMFGTLFMLAMLWVVESFEPKTSRAFSLEVKAKDRPSSNRRWSRFFRAAGSSYTLRATSEEEICYDVGCRSIEKPMGSRTKSQIDPDNAKAVEFKEKKKEKGIAGLAIVPNWSATPKSLSRKACIAACRSASVRRRKTTCSPPCMPCATRISGSRSSSATTDRPAIPFCRSFSP